MNVKTKCEVKFLYFQLNVGVREHALQDLF